MQKTVLFVLALLFLTTARITYAQPYLCGSTGLIYSDQSFCNSSCGSTCQSLDPQTAGTSYTCPSSGYKSFIYSPTTGYTYGLTTNTGFWTSFNQPSNNPSLAIIPDATTNRALASMLSYYGVSKAWIGAYDSSMSTSYNTVNPQSYIWWNNSAINYSNWASGQPNNLLNSNDIGVVPTQGNHWAYMSSNGQWSADGYHYNYPSSQNYAPYYNALVQWSGPLSCVNGAAPASPPITNTDITNAVNQYCNGQTPCFMCTDTSQCTPQSQCPVGYTYVSANNDCEAPASCPAGGTLNSNSGSCTASLLSVACPNNYTYNSTNNDCEASATNGCNSGGTYNPTTGQCTLPPNNGCPAGYNYNSTNNDCEAYPSPQCNVGTAALINGQNQCIASPSYSCPDSQYSYNTLVANQCAAQANIYCPDGGSFSGGQCVSTTSPCPTGYTLHGGLCTAEATITCPGSGTYNDIYGVCIEPSQTNCPSGFTYNSSNSLCLAPIFQYVCPGSGNYDPNKGMCTTPVQQTCVTGYTLSNGQCLAPGVNSCPLPGTYDPSKGVCTATPNSYNCPTGYTYSNGACVASSVCPEPGSYNAAEQACSAPLQPCSPASNNMQQCIQTSSGWLCPLSSAVCTTQNGNVNQFTNGGIVSPEVYGGGGTWISTSGANGIYNGYMSFYNYEANLPAGTYEIGCAADDEGWLYVNGQYLGNCFISSVSSYPYNSNGGLINITLAVINSCPNCPLSGNPSGVYAQVVNSSGQIVLTTSTNWQASLNPSVFGYAATCPSGYTYNSSYNACTAPISSSNWNPSGTQPAPVYVSSQNYINWTGTPYSVYGGERVPNGYVSYYETTYYAPTTMTVPVTLCADDNGILYINGNKITSHSTGGSVNYCSTVTTTIPAGTNIIEVSLVNDCSSCNGPNPTAMSVVINGTSLSNWNGAYQPGVLWTVYPFASFSSQLCPSGGNYSSLGFCYAAPTITFDLQCPLGSYQCMPNGQGGYSCSTLTCQDVNTGVQRVPINQNNNPTNNGTVTDQGCLGTIYIFNGRTYNCREAGIETGFSNCCSSSSSWFGLGKCWQNEMELQQKRDSGFCHYTGTFCAAKFLGICLQKVEAYCCFNGVLARIIQEQGRIQGLPEYGWGPGDDPHCEGFTPTQFQALDWSKIDLSEYYVYIQQTFVPNIQNNINKGINNAINKLQEGYSNQ